MTGELFAGTWNEKLFFHAVKLSKLDGNESDCRMEIAANK